MLHRSITANLLAAVMAFLGVTLGSGNHVATAAPSIAVRAETEVLQVLPDWMPEDSAAQLDVGLDVLVPFSIPGPFSGVPQITASGGYYSLYWFIGGGNPTLLQITGTAGGSIPA